MATVITIIKRRVEVERFWMKVAEVRHWTKYSVSMRSNANLCVNAYTTRWLVSLIAIDRLLFARLNAAQKVFSFSFVMSSVCVERCWRYFLYQHFVALFVDILLGCVGNWYASGWTVTSRQIFVLTWKISASSVKSPPRFLSRFEFIIRDRTSARPQSRLSLSFRSRII